MLVVVWILAVTCSVAVCVQQLGAKVRKLPHTPFTATASSDALLGAEAPGLTAAEIRNAMRDVPAWDSVLFVGVQGDVRFTQTLYTVSVLALPHQMPAINCPTGGSGRGGVSVPFDPERPISAVIFVGVPPTIPTAVELAPGVWWQRIAPLSGRSQWTSFCPLPPQSSS